MVATSTETRAAIFRKRKHAAEKGMSVSKRSKKLALIALLLSSDNLPRKCLFLTGFNF